MEMVGWLSNDFAAAIASNGKIQKIFREKPEIASPEGAEPMERMRGEICFDHVDFAINGKEILKDVSFTVPAGSTLGIMGMTGAGKSSVVNLIQRFYDAASGQVLIDGKDVRSLSLSDLRRQISVVMQDVFLFSDTIEDNIKTGNRDAAEWESVERASVCADAHGFIMKLTEQYDTIIGERGVGLSGGQKQRISIARAIAKENPVLILDDSTSALDMETEKEIQRQLQELKSCTKIIIGHRISAVQNADQILILENGRVAERGTHEELLKKRGLYYQTFKVQYGEEEMEWQ